MPGLRLRFKGDDDGDEMLCADVHVGSFRGAAQYWLYASAFSDFAAALTQFPISQTIEGTWAGLSIIVEPRTAAGRLKVGVVVTDPDDKWVRCQAAFDCYQAEIDRFREALLKVIAEGQGEATLAPAQQVPFATPASP